MFLKLLVVVYSFTDHETICNGVLQKKIELKSIIYAIYQIWLYAGGHLGRHLEYVRVLEEDFLERLLC